MGSNEEQRDEEALATEEAEAAAAEAAGIGGKVIPDSDDPAEQPLIEAGEGEAEGFELAERDLEDIAGHGDQHRFPDSVPPPPEEPSEAAYGEADEPTSQIGEAGVRRRLLAIVTGDPLGPESLDEIRADGDPDRGDGVDLRVIAPAVEANAFRHTLGDIDEPKREAEARLGRVLDELRASGIEAGGEVGDPDPIQAARDALLKAPADEIVIFEHEQAQARWFEEGLLEKARAGLDPPLRMVVLHSDRDGTEHVVHVEAQGRGTKDPAEGHEIGSSYLPGLSRADLGGMVAGILGTIVVAILAAAVAVDTAEVSGRAAAAILIAIGIALINMAHVVGLTLMESVRYRGGFAKLFRYLSLVGTPLAVVVILVLLIT
jgi:hypothetical protein